MALPTAVNPQITDAAVEPSSQKTKKSGKARKAVKTKKAAKSKKATPESRKRNK